MATASLFPEYYTDQLPARFLRHVNRVATLRPFTRKPKPDVQHDVHHDLFDIRHLSRGQAWRLWELSRRDSRLYGLNRALGDMLGVDWDNLPDETMTDRIQRFLHETEGRR